MNRTYNDSQIIDLHSTGLTDKEIAEILGVKVNNLATKRRHLGLAPNKSKRETHQLTKEELEILIGTLLGDSTIRYVHNQCKYPNLTFTHGVNQEEYFNWLSNKLSALKASTGLYDSKYIRTNGEIAKRFVFTGQNMPCLKELRDIFYVDNKKIIPISYIQDKFTELSFYCLFMDDGSYDITDGSYILNTQCFSEEELKAFTNFLAEKFSLEFNIKSDHSLYLRHKSNDVIYNMLKSINECNSMSYKYGDSRLKTPLNGETPVKDNPVLNPQETVENA
jgi:hypothetical protein